MRVDVSCWTPLGHLEEKWERPWRIERGEIWICTEIETNPDGSRAPMISWLAGLESSFYASYYRSLEWLTMLSVDSQLAWSTPG